MSFSGDHLDVYTATGELPPRYIAPRGVPQPWLVWLGQDYGRSSEVPHRSYSKPPQSPWRSLEPSVRAISRPRWFPIQCWGFHSLCRWRPAPHLERNQCATACQLCRLAACCRRVGVVMDLTQNQLSNDWMDQYLWCAAMTARNPSIAPADAVNVLPLVKQIMKLLHPPLPFSLRPSNRDHQASTEILWGVLATWGLLGKLHGGIAAQDFTSISEELKQDGPFFSKGYGCGPYKFTFWGMYILTYIDIHM